MLEKLEKIAAKVVKKFGSSLQAVDRFGDEMTLIVARDKIAEILAYLRDQSDCAFKQLVDLCAVDYPNRPQRFEVVYHLLSYKYNCRLRLKVYVDEENTVPSVIKVYPAANWYEREAWDLYGVKFAGHPDLSRILTDYAFEGHPLRKDFPLSGYVEPRYDDDQKRVIYGPIQLPQEFRTFDFLSPWEGITPGRLASVLPGDEKANA
jgi:NADH-quinone oxidoreductase subunit C